MTRSAWVPYSSGSTTERVRPWLNREFCVVRFSSVRGGETGAVGRGGGGVVVAAVGVGAAYTETGGGAPSPSAAAAATRLSAEAGATGALEGCNRPGDPAVTDQLQGMVVDGTPRWYLLTTPAPGYAQPVGGDGGTPAEYPRPLVLDFHGCGRGRPCSTRSPPGSGVLGQQDGFVVVVPRRHRGPPSTGTPRTTARPIPIWRTSPPSSTRWSRPSASTPRGSTPAASPTGRSWRPCWPAPCPIGSPPSVRSPAWSSGSPVTPPVRSRSSPSTARRPDPLLQRRGGLRHADPAARTGRAGGPAAHRHPTGRPDGPGVPATVRAWAVKDGCGPNGRPTPRWAPRSSCAATGAPPGPRSSSTIIVGGGHSWPGSPVSGGRTPGRRRRPTRSTPPLRCGGSSGSSGCSRTGPDPSPRRGAAAVPPGPRAPGTMLVMASGGFAALLARQTHRGSGPASGGPGGRERLGAIWWRPSRRPTVTSRRILGDLADANDQVAEAIGRSLTRSERGDRGAPRGTPPPGSDPG